MMFRMKLSFDILVVMLLFQNLVIGNSETQLTEEEKTAISKFRNMVKDKLYQDYMKSDWYLIPWLRAKKFDLNKAKEMLESSLLYRKENNVDDLIHNKEMKLWMTTKFPLKLDGVDKEGRPVLQVSVGMWNIRRAMLAGQRKELAKYIDFVYETVAVRIREERNKTGENITQYIHLYDMHNYNLKQHGCLSCLPFFYDLVTHYELHYPGQARYIILINTPQFFKSVLEFIRPLMAPATRRDLKIFRNDKTEWSKFIGDLIELDQLPPQFGGTKRIK